MQKVDSWDFNAVALLKAALKSPYGVKRLSEDPIATARSFGFELDPALAPAIKDMDLSAKTRLFDDAADEEVADFFHSTITDGRYVADWADDPAGVADKLGIVVSDAAIQRAEWIRGNIDLDTIGDLQPMWGRIIITIGIAIIIAAGPRRTVIPVIQPEHIDRI